VTGDILHKRTHGMLVKVGFEETENWKKSKHIICDEKKTFKSNSRGEQSNFIELGINVLANVDTELVIKPKENSS